MPINLVSLEVVVFNILCDSVHLYFAFVNSQTWATSADDVKLARLFLLLQ
jgi:hypothetical protein